jgi:hypothetical protein
LLLFDDKGNKRKNKLLEAASSLCVALDCSVGRVRLIPVGAALSWRRGLPRWCTALRRIEGLLLLLLPLVVLLLLLLVVWRWRLLARGRVRRSRSWRTRVESSGRSLLRQRRGRRGVVALGRIVVLALRRRVPHGNRRELHGQVAGLGRAEVERSAIRWHLRPVRRHRRG